jgi:hypothetical protein
VTHDMRIRAPAGICMICLIYYARPFRLPSTTQVCLEGGPINKSYAVPVDDELESTFLNARKWSIIHLIDRDARGLS